MGIHYKAQALLVKNIACYNKLDDGNHVLRRVRKKIRGVAHYLLSTITASDIDIHAHLEPDLVLPHPTGVVIHRDVVIGSGCTIMQQVTIGQLSDGAAPIIGNNVYIGTGAKILGGILIGNNARIGANAVVLETVPDNSTAVGVPAKIIRR